MLANNENIAVYDQWLDFVVFTVYFALIKRFVCYHYVNWHGAQGVVHVCQSRLQKTLWCDTINRGVLGTGACVTNGRDSNAIVVNPY